MFEAKLIRQCRKPTGWVGRFVGRRMNSEHADLRHWGLERVAMEPTCTVLDIGCGGGRTVEELAALAPRGQVYGVDLSPDMVKLSRRVNRRLIDSGRVRIEQSSVSSLPFDDSTFDLVTAFETWYFWPRPVEDLKEIRRVLKPGGRLLVANNAYRHERFMERNRKWAQWADMRLDTPDEYRLIFEEAGFTGITIDLVEEKNRIGVTAGAAK